MLTGPSGAGKSTLVSLLLREADPDRGNLRIGGVDLRALDPAELAGAVGLVGQRIDLFRDTLAANLRLARPTASDDELLAALAAAGAADLVRRLPQGLYAPVGDQGSALSGGERQRVAIARALLKDARLLIFDEATSALDAETEAAVVGELRRLAGERTVILVTHRLACAAAAERIVVMADGRVEAVGGHAELLAASPCYARLWAAHGRNGRWSLRGAPFPSSTSPGDAP